MMNFSKNIVGDKPAISLYTDKIKKSAGALAVCAAAALVMNLVIEGLSRHSITGGLEFLASSPKWFLFSLAELFISYAATLFFKRRVFACLVVSSLWLTVGIANCVLLFMRETPLTAVDFVIITDALSIIPLYLNPLSFALIAGGAAAVCALAVFAYRRAPRFDPRPVCALCAMLLAAGMVAVGLFSGDDSSDTNEHYGKYGFILSFSSSVFDKGVDRPEDYGGGDVADALGLVPAASAPAEDIPNIIYVQLESFFDVTRLRDVELSGDPIPFFRSLCDSFSSGSLTVPVVGGGTANTEFEVLTGMSTGCFGTGEYPYTTLLTEEVCPSFAFDCADAGLRTHAIHNHSGGFYGRNKVYANLGFGSFTPIEYMTGVTKNPLGWAKDECLTGEILSALESTEERDFVFAVSVQGHGKYPDEFEDAGITAGGEGSEDGERRAKLEYFVSQLREMDDFLRELVAALESTGEPVLLVLYGDHLPALGISEEELKGSLHETEYVIWSSFPLEERDRALDTCTLSAAVGELAGIPGNIFMRLNRAALSPEADRESFGAALRVLIYDALYGDRLAWGGALPWEAGTLSGGTRPIEITSIRMANGGAGLLVEGTGFTEYSLIVIDGILKHDTEFREGSLYLAGRIPAGSFTVEVVQYGEGVVLGATPPVFAEGRRAALTAEY